MWVTGGMKTAKQFTSQHSGPQHSNLARSGLCRRQAVLWRKRRCYPSRSYLDVSQTEASKQPNNRHKLCNYILKTKKLAPLGASLGVKFRSRAVPYLDVSGPHCKGKRPYLAVSV